MRSQTLIVPLLGCLILIGSPVYGQVASALIREGEPLPGDQLGSEITSISNSATNAVGGFSFTVTTDSEFSNVWGNTIAGPGTVLQAEQTIGDITITSFESFFGMSDDGSVFYGTTSSDSSTGVTGLDGVFLNDTLILNEEDTIAALPGQFSTFNSRPGITANGTPYWVGGISTVQGGGSQNRVLFRDTTVTPVIMGGDSITGVAEPLVTGSAIDFDVRFSAMATNYIMVGDVSSSSSNDLVVVTNGAAVEAGGSLIREGTLIPAGIGGLGDSYASFDFLGITESGGFLLTGDSDGATATDEFVMINGQIVLREGDSVGAGTLAGGIEGAFLNEDGDWAVIWDYDKGGSNLEVLIVNGDEVLAEGDAVDFNGDGAIDANDNGAVLEDFNGISALTISRRNVMGDTRAYFVADVLVDGNTVEAAFEMTVNVAKIIKGDVNGDGEVNLLDVQPFIDAIGGMFVPEADINMDGVVNLLDVQPFIDLLNG